MNSSGVDAQELVIENDRLKTTIMILTQKLKLKEDDSQGTNEKFKIELNRQRERGQLLQEENESLKAQLSKL
jgi:hypothetical protein